MEKWTFPYGCYERYPFSYDRREMSSQILIDRREMLRFKMTSEQFRMVNYNFHKQIPTAMDERDVFQKDLRENLAFKKYKGMTA